MERGEEARRTGPEMEAGKKGGSMFQDGKKGREERKKDKGQKQDR